MVMDDGEWVVVWMAVVVVAELVMKVRVLVEVGGGGRGGDESKGGSGGGGDGRMFPEEDFP